MHPMRPLAAGAEAVDPLGMDLDDHPSLARTEVGIRVPAQILLRELVYVLERVPSSEPFGESGFWGGEHRVISCAHERRRTR